MSGVPTAKGTLLYAGSVALAAMFFITGFGMWGTGVWGDNALDLADALRAFQGDIPYRDFLPTYGPLHMAFAPLFTLGRAFFPAYWTAIFFLIIVQLVVIVWMVRRRVGIFWGGIAALLFVACGAFAPINAQLMQGYSMSGFLGTLGWTLVLWLLWSAPSRGPRWFEVGAILGLQPFTKMDTGLAACAVLVTLGVVLGARDGRAALRLAGGFLVAWSAVLLSLVCWGGDPQLILESGLEGMGQAMVFGDVVLKHRIEALLLVGILLALVWAFPSPRQKMVRLERNFGPWLAWLFPLALVIDGIRGWPAFSLKSMVAMNFFCVLVWVLVTARLGGSLLRWRSLRALRFRTWPSVLAMWVISGVGIVRVAFTGWYPLNYGQPAALLLALFWCVARSPKGQKGHVAWRTALVAAVCFPLALVFHRMNHPLYPATWLSTPFGTVPIAMDPATSHDLSEVLRILDAAPPGETLLCTYEPSTQLLSGMRSAAFYTYFGRVGFSGRYQPTREAQSWDLFMRRRPQFVLWDTERASFSRFFGSDHSRALCRWIEEHYEPSHTSPPLSQVQMRLYRRRD